MIHEYNSINKSNGFLTILSENLIYIITITGDLFVLQHTDIDIAFDFVKVAIQIMPVHYANDN